MIITEQGAWWETLFGTEPSRKRLAPVIPLLPTTIRSASRLPSQGFRKVALMASRALIIWRTDSSTKLDELAAAHASVGGTGRGRRYATEQLNASLVVQLAAHFQLFCRDLHTEAARLLILAAPASYQSMLEVAFTKRRGLDRGIASAQTIGADFARLDLDIWAQAANVSSRSATRRARLDQLTAWRNAIAHQDFAFSSQQQALLAGTRLTMAWARRWRGACDGLAQTFDTVVAVHVRAVTGLHPW